MYLQMPAAAVLRMADMKWAAGKGSYRHTSFHPNGREASEDAIILPRSASVRSRSLSTFLLPPVQRLMSACVRPLRLLGRASVSDWGFVSLGVAYGASCFQHLQETQTHKHTHTVFFIIIVTHWLLHEAPPPFNSGSNALVFVRFAQNQPYKQYQRFMKKQKTSTLLIPSYFLCFLLLMIVLGFSLTHITLFLFFKLAAETKCKKSFMTTWPYTEVCRKQYITLLLLL